MLSKRMLTKWLIKFKRMTSADSCGFCKKKVDPYEYAYFILVRNIRENLAFNRMFTTGKLVSLS